MSVFLSPKKVFFYWFVILCFLCKPINSKANEQITPHYAEYSLELSSVKNSDIVSANGHMTYKLVDTCKGWDTEQKITLQTISREGENHFFVFYYTAFENKDERYFSFHTRQLDNGNIQNETQGQAYRKANKTIIVRYTLPTSLTLLLPSDTFFPLAQMQQILKSAQAGNKFLTSLLFDGTSTDGLQDTYITLSQWKNGNTQLIFPSLRMQPSIRVHIAFFTHRSYNVLPSHEIGMRYFLNGVSDQLDIDFEVFRIHGELRKYKNLQRNNHC